MEDIPANVCPESQLQRFIDSRAKGKSKELQKKILCANREKKIQCQSGQKRKRQQTVHSCPSQNDDRSQENQLLSEFSVLKVKFEDLSAENETLSSNIDELQNRDD